MRVMCIHGIKPGAVNFLNQIATDEEAIYESDVYTVESEVKRFGKRYYILSERPPKTCYRTDRFITLLDESDIEAINSSRSLHICTTVGV